MVLLLVVTVVGGFLLSGDFLGEDSTSVTVNVPHIPLTPPYSSDSTAAIDPSSSSSSDPAGSNNVPPVTDPNATTAQTGSNIPPETSVNTTGSGDITLTPPPVTTPAVTDPIHTPSEFLPVNGRLTSDNETRLKLMLDWSTVTRTSDSATVEFKVVLSYYTLGCRAVSGTLIVGDETFKFTSDPIDDLENTTRKNKELTLATFTATVPLSGGNGSVDVRCVWNFKGKYSGVQFTELTVNGPVIIEG